jgi:hypothetical protein
VLDDEPKNPSEYAGPFRFMDSRGERHKVFIAAKYIDGVQARCADTILNVSTLLDAAGRAGQKGAST